MTRQSRSPVMTTEQWVADAVAQTPAPTPEQLAEVRRCLAPTKTSETLTATGGAA